MNRTTWQFVGVALLALALGGCGSATQPSSGLPENGRAEQGRSSLGPQELDVLTHSGNYATDETELLAAADELTQRCMADRGFHYPIEQQSVVDESTERATVDMTRRRKHGYGIVERSAGTKQRRPAADSYVSSLPAAVQRKYLAALFGASGRRVKVELPDGLEMTTVVGGCSADAQRELGSDPIAWIRFTYYPMQLGNRLAQEVTASPEYQAHVREWSLCMARAGYRYTSPEQAQDSLRAVASRTTLDQEVAVASQDGECALSTHLPATSLRIRRDLAHHLPVHERRALISSVAQRERVVHRAEALAPG